MRWKIGSSKLIERRIVRAKEIAGKKEKTEEERRMGGRKGEGEGGREKGDSKINSERERERLCV